MMIVDIILDPPATNYANAGGTGDRTASIAATASYTPANGSAPRTVDGSFAGNSAGAIQVLASGSAAGEYVQWDFGAGTPKYTDEITLYQNGNIILTCRFDYSDDAASWIAMGGTFLFNANAQVVAVTMLPEGARYIRLVFVSGTYPGAGYFSEIEFKIAPGAT
jgi:hypothetical protein